MLTFEEYIGTYFFNVASLLFFFWSLMLFVSVWEIQNRALKSDRFVTGSKWTCFLLPAVQVVVSNLPQVKRRVALHLALGNCTSKDSLSTNPLSPFTSFFQKPEEQTALGIWLNKRDKKTDHGQ